MKTSFSKLQAIREALLGSILPAHCSGAREDIFVLNEHVNLGLIVFNGEHINGQVVLTVGQFLEPHDVAKVCVQFVLHLPIPIPQKGQQCPDVWTVRLTTQL